MNHSVDLPAHYCICLVSMVAAGIVELISGALFAISFKPPIDFYCFHNCYFSDSLFQEFEDTGSYLR